MSRVVLLVDDEPDITALFRRVLKRTFDEVLVAFSGDEATEILDHKPVTHVVSDYFLGPDSTQGTKLIADWRSHHPSIRFAAIFTGRASTGDFDGMPGIDAAFAKPAGFEDLIERLNAAP